VVDEPVSIGILVWVLSNIFGTSVPPSRAINWAALLVAAGLSPWSGVIVFKTCPVTAERCVKNHRVVSEVVVNAAGGSTNVTGRLSPQCWVRKAEGNISWDFSTREVPDLDGQVCPFLDIVSC
jgi:hypothetical protein